MADSNKDKTESSDATPSMPSLTQDSAELTPAEQTCGESSKSKASIDAGEDREGAVGNESSLIDRRGLRTQVSKLFGDEAIMREAIASNTRAQLSGYRPISLMSRDAEGISLSGIIDEVYNANRHSTGGSSNSGRPSLALSAMSALSKEAFAALPALDLHQSVSASFASQRSSAPASSRVSFVTQRDTGRASMSALSREVADGFSTAGLQDPFTTSPEAAHPVVAEAADPVVSDDASEVPADSSDDQGTRVATSSGLSQQIDTPAPSREEVASALAARLGLADESVQDILDAFNTIAPPPLDQHPMFRGDLPAQGRVGIVDYDSSNNAACTIHLPKGTLARLAARRGLHVPPLNVRRQRAEQKEPVQRPTQVALSTRNASRTAPARPDPNTGLVKRGLSTVPDVLAGQDPRKDVDPSPAFDRTVDLVWYRQSNTRGDEQQRMGLLPDPMHFFHHVTSSFTARLFRGRETNKYDKLRRRFRYFDLDPKIRYRIMVALIEEHLPGKPVLLNRPFEAAPVWPDDEFARLWDVLGPLQNYLNACPDLRSDVMVALLMKQPIHVIFSPYVKGETSPLPTKWLFKYLYYMQDVRVELDMTRLGFGASWEAGAMSTKLWDIGNLVHVFVEEMLWRNARQNPMLSLTIHCRRFFGYRQGEDPHRGDKNFYRYPLIRGENEGPGKATLHPNGQPWSIGRHSTTLPPSANNPYSGHRRHHSYNPDRVPFVHESHMSIANAFTKLAGRVWSVRMCGLSEKWVRENHMKFWPADEYANVVDHAIHIDRYMPTKHSYVHPGHAVYVDYGINCGVHRFPPLPDSEPMVCVGYDGANDYFVEAGSGNILTVFEGGVEVIARCEHPPLPRSELARLGGPAVPLDGFARRPSSRSHRVVTPSRIPTPVGGVASPAMRAMREGTPHKALRILGLPSRSLSTVKKNKGTAPEKEEEKKKEEKSGGGGDDDVVTPTRAQQSRATSSRRRPSVRPSSRLTKAVDEQLGELLAAQRDQSARKATE